MTALEENLERLEEAIAEACRRRAFAWRSRADGRVEDLSGGRRLPRLRRLGLRLFGENRVQEFAAKASHAAALRTACATEDAPRASDRAFAIEQGGAGGGAV